MRARFFTIAAAIVPALALTLASGPAAVAVPATAARPAALARPAGQAAVPAPVKTAAACSTSIARRHVRCLALVRVTKAGQPLISHNVSASSPPAGLAPGQLQSAYQLAKAAATRGAKQTVALVDAYDDPNAASDLGVYRQQFGLPACTAASGCFRKVNQDGAASPLPPTDPGVSMGKGWELEEASDIEMVSAVCPECHILLVEANNSDDTNLAAGVATAARLGATEISNSYGEPEFPGETKLAPFYDQPGVQVTASAGDSGYGVSWPAASANVTSVGGTTLWKSGTGRGWQERAWSGTGSGCSTVIAKPGWQHDGCTHRMDNDVAADADPASAVAIYDSFGGFSWWEVGGTSVSSPIVAGVYALEGDPHTPGGSYFYQHPHNVFDVTSGANGTCQPASLCTAGPGYDGPTGLGTPAFTGTVKGPNCVSNWSPAPPEQDPSLDDLTSGVVTDAFSSGVDTLSSRNVWTAGTIFAPGAVSTNIEHWTGSSWTHVRSPNPLTVYGQPNAQLAAISFDRADDGWAVGDANGTPLAAHWNGSRWSISPVLTPMDTFQENGQTRTMEAEPSAVAAISPDNVWLAGSLWTDELFPVGGFLEHFNGSTWQIVKLPTTKFPPAIYGITAISASDVWAVGFYAGFNGLAFLHWNGRAWSTAKAPSATNPGAILAAVSGTAPDNVWAVGYVPGGGQVTDHWNGHAWSAVAVTQPLHSALYGVTAISASNVWAVGGYDPNGNFGSYQLEHWDGQHWSLVPAPQQADGDSMFGVSASGPGAVWATGNQELWANRFDTLQDGPSNIEYGCRNA